MRQAHIHIASLSLHMATGRHRILNKTSFNLNKKKTETQRLKKSVVVDVPISKYNNIFKNGQQKILDQTSMQMINLKIVRQINLKYGQISKMCPKNG